MARIKSGEMPKILKRASKINRLEKILKEIDSLIYKAKRYDIGFKPDRLIKKYKEIEDYHQKGKDGDIQAKAINRWKHKWEKEYDDQLPKVIITPIIQGLTPIQMILYGLLQSNVRTIPLMVDVLRERSRNTVFVALSGLVEKGLVIRVSNAYYFESTWDLTDARIWAKRYMASKRNPNGVIPKVRKFGFDEYSTKVIDVMHNSGAWNTIENYKSRGLSTD